MKGDTQPVLPFIYSIITAWRHCQEKGWEKWLQEGRSNQL